MQLPNKKTVIKTLPSINKLNVGKINQNKGKTDQQSLSVAAKPVKTMAAPLMTKTHYSFEEAIGFIKSIYPNFTHANLLNHGFQKDVSFFIKVPAEFAVRSFVPGADARSNTVAPAFLTISIFECEAIERNGAVQCNSFSSGYCYDEASALIEALPNFNFSFQVSPIWQTFLNGYPYALEISIKNLSIIHSELIELVQKIKLRISGNLDSKIQQEILNEIQIGKAPKELVSLIDAVFQQPECKPMDLLRRAIQRKLTLMVHVPKGVAVRSSNFADVNSGVEYFQRPLFLEVSESDCINIYNNESFQLLDFPAGWIYDYYGRVRRITPDHERPWLLNEKPSWRTYQGNQALYLVLNCEKLYALRSDIAELIDPDESQEFKIPKETIQLLLNNGFVTLERAVQIAKLKHPNCTINHLLRLGFEKKLDIATPIPRGITVHRYKNIHKYKIPFDNPSKYPVLLKLCLGVCEAIEKHQKYAVDIFASDYWIFQDKFEYKNADNSDYWGLVAYCENKLYQIELKPDCLYVDKSCLLNLIESGSGLWKAIDQMLMKDAENKKRELEALDLINVNASSTDEINLEFSTADSADQCRIQQNGEATAGKPHESTHESIKFLSRIDVMQCLGIRKSTMHNFMNPQSKYYDPEFPKPIGNGSHKKSWVAHEVEAYQSLLMNRRSGSGRGD